MKSAKKQAFPPTLRLDRRPFNGVCKFSLKFNFMYDLKIIIKKIKVFKYGIKLLIFKEYFITKNGKW